MMESWKNNGIALLASALLIVSGESKAETIVTHRLLETVGHSTLQCEFASEVFANPSLQSLHYPVSLNTLSVGYDYRYATQPASLESGDAHH